MPTTVTPTTASPQPDQRTLNYLATDLEGGESLAAYGARVRPSTASKLAMLDAARHAARERRANAAGRLLSLRLAGHI